MKTETSTQPTIAFVIDELEVGGAQCQLQLMATGLSQRGWQVHVICLQPILAMAADFTNAGIPVHLIQKHTKLDVRLISRLCRFFVKHQVEIVHPMSSTAEFFAGLAAQYCRIPFVASILDTNTVLPLSHRLGKRLACFLARAIVANSQAGAQVAAAAGLVAADKVQVIPNGIPPHAHSTSWEEMRRGLGLPVEASVVLSVGRLVWEKGYETTLAIARQTGTWQSAPHFLIAGDGPLRTALVQQIQASGLTERVHLLGERRDIPALLAAADVYLNTSISEGLSNSIMEAMVAEVPVLAAAVGGTPELIQDGETGLLFPPGDLATAVMKLDRLTRDSNLRSRLSQQARQRIETIFNCNTMISQFEGLYRRVIEPRGQYAAFPVENGL
jgi:glycosyltransferase involved in cell wall biosynthesis